MSVRRIPLQLGVKISPWRPVGESERYLEAWGKDRLAILERDKFTCRGCGFRSKGDADAPSWTLRRSGYLEIHHINDDHFDNDKRNLVTLCPLCHAGFTVGLSGHKGGTLIYFPWLEQWQINLLINVAACARIRAGVYELSAMSLLGFFSEQGRKIQAMFEDAANLGTVLHVLARENPAAYAQREKALAHLRLFHNVNDAGLIEAFKYWAENVWNDESQWVRFAQDA